jgi:glycosyltransferase involved in cell wall biosynthesis
LWPEAFPLVLLEAMAAGRPLLVTDQGGLPAVVDPEIGCVVDADVDGLSAGLLAMTADRDALARKGARARARYEGTYHPRAVTEALVAIYADVLAERA